MKHVWNTDAERAYLARYSREARFPRGWSRFKYKRVGRWKQFVRKAFRYRCGYCTVSEGELKGQGHFHVDHFAPRSSFPEKARDYFNLVYACSDCNVAKGSEYAAELVDPGSEARFPYHLYENDCEIRANSPRGKSCVEIPDLNRLDLIKLRQNRARTQRDFVETLSRLLGARAKLRICADRYGRTAPTELLDAIEDLGTQLEDERQRWRRYRCAIW